jgi:predicted aspartyl protease
MSQRLIYPLERQNGLLFTRAAVSEEQSSPVVARLLVDTGSSFTVISRRVLQNIGVNLQGLSRSVSIVAAGGVLRAPIVRVSSFNAFGRSVKSYSVVALDLPNDIADGLLGIDFLRNCGATIDVKRSQIIVETMTERTE